RDTNTFNPFASCNADVLRELLVSQIERNPQGGANDPNGVFLSRAVALLGALAPVLVWLRDNRNIPIDIEKIRLATELRSVIALALHSKYRLRDPEAGTFTEIDLKEEPAIPPAYLFPLQAYLGETGGFDVGSFGKDSSAAKIEEALRRSDEPARQHSFAVMHFSQTFTQMAVSLGHIFKVESSDIDMRDIVLNRRILAVNLPTLENSGESTAALGKIVVATLRNMMAQTLGADLEGNFDDIIANNAAESATPFPVIFDEVGYYAVTFHARQRQSPDHHPSAGGIRDEELYREDRRRHLRHPGQPFRCDRIGRLFGRDAGRGPPGLTGRLAGCPGIDRG
ncbi:MAG: hypothetical protein B7X49_10705, partial [Acidiphilium sp. 34-64-41]